VSDIWIDDLKSPVCITTDPVDCANITVGLIRPERLDKTQSEAFRAWKNELLQSIPSAYGYENSAF